MTLKTEIKKVNATASSPQLKTEFAIYKTLLHINQQQSALNENANLEFQADFSGANKIPQIEAHKKWRDE